MYFFDKINLFLQFWIFYISIFADRAAGYFTSSHAKGLVFPPNSEVIYETSEFTFTAKTNSLGFRDYEYSLNKNSKYRILVLGDSFTFGWGVEIENTWIKVLEKEVVPTKLITTTNSGNILTKNNPYKNDLFLTLQPLKTSIQAYFLRRY